MFKKLILILLAVMSLLLLASCNEQNNSKKAGEIVMDEASKSEGEVVQIVSFIKMKAGEVLKSFLFPKANNGLFTSDEQLADERMEQIVSAIRANDKEALKSLFSQKSIEACADWDDEVNALFDFLQGDISSWERVSCPSNESVEYGKRTLMILPKFEVVTDVEEYRFYLIDYAIDTIDPDNEGVYMLEVCKLSYNGEWESWMDRMRAGISIVE